MLRASLLFPIATVRSQINRNGLGISCAAYCLPQLPNLQTGIVPALIADVKAAVCYLRDNAAEYGIVPNCFAVMGESAGDYGSCMMVIIGNKREFDVGDHLDQSSEIQAVININGKMRQVRGGQEKVNQNRPRNTTELLVNG